MNVTTARINATEERRLLDWLATLEFPVDPDSLPAWAWTPAQMGCPGCVWCDLAVRKKKLAKEKAK